MNMPPGDLATRGHRRHQAERIAWRTGDIFELNLLLTQTEALSYAWQSGERAAGLAGAKYNR